MDNLKRKSSLNVAPATVPNPPLHRHQSLQESERTYIFSGSEAQSALPSGIRFNSGHSRSMSHGGVSGPLRPSLKSAMKSGHQRASSQGQIKDAHKPGHSRVGSKTDFILPPTHKDPERNKESSSSVRGHSRQASRSESIYTLRRQDMPGRRWMFWRTNKFEEQGIRQILPNDTAQSVGRDHPNAKYADNKIRTTKYTLLTFLPKNLMEQFHRVANIYFIFIQFLNWIPELKVFGKEIAVIPLAFVLLVTLFKDLFEDRRRYKSDKRINSSQCRVYNSEQQRYIKSMWQDIRVGDFVHLSNNETVPADILLLKSSEMQGTCFIETCDLDGETSLKRRQVARGLSKHHTSFSPSKFESKFEVDSPTTKIYRFHGAMVHSSGERVPISTENLLLRESRLKNTSYVEGIVIYAGHESKAMLNNSGPRYKRSQLERAMNIDVFWCVFILFLLCLIGAIGCQWSIDKYLGLNVQFIPETIAYEGFWMFFRLVIILQILIPLALYVTIEVTKVLQVYFIHNSLDLYDPQTDKCTECRAMNITEELGQVQYIFSDKTGTLTQNRMIFRHCTIDGIDFGHPPSEDDQHSSPNAPIPQVVPNLNLLSDLSQLESNERPSPHAQHCKEFLKVLALCNSVLVSDRPHRDNMNASGELQEENGIVSNSINCDEFDDSSPIQQQPPHITAMKLHHIPSLSPISSSAESSPESESPPMRVKAVTPTERVRSLVSKLPIMPHILASGRAKKKMARIAERTAKSKHKAGPLPIYEAESPDELALVNTAFAYGYILESRTPNTVLIQEPGEGAVEYDILIMLPFDSHRKKMSVVLRKVGGQEVVLYTKGADSAIIPSLASIALNTDEYALREKTIQQLEVYAKQGLRVLVIAKRILNPVEFSEWYSSHQECEMSTDGRDKKIRDSFGVLERKLTLVGATGIEDRLQEGVPETITALLSAGIVVWVLTGDKTETAINVAFSAKLFNPDMEIIKIIARSRLAAENCIKFYMGEIERQIVESRGENWQKRALVTDGKTLTFILDAKSNLTAPFLELTRYCDSVLCCRSTPLQKGFLVKAVKQGLKMSTLAIGDGANDVSMIQMADVGVGICGQEGMQAVMASDFAIAKFKILEKLLIVHGSMNYYRLAQLIIYFFYKNATFVFVLFWFQFYCGFSGAVMMEQIHVMIYNFMFTAASPIALGAFEKRMNDDLLLKSPELYKYGRLGRGYYNHFWFVMLDSLWQSFVIFFVAVYSYDDSDIGLWQFGSTIVSSCLVTMLCHFALEVKTWTIIHVGAILVSLSSFYTFAFIYNTFCTTFLDLPNTAMTIHDAMSTMLYYLVIIITPVIALLPRCFSRTMINSLRPSDEIVLQLSERNRKHNRSENLFASRYSRTTSQSSESRFPNNAHKNVSTIS